MRRLAGRSNQAGAAAATLITVGFLVAGGFLPAKATPVVRPLRAQLPSPHVAWRRDGVDVGGGFGPETAHIAGGVAVFVVDLATADVLSLDVATGKLRWRMRAPKAASLPKRPTM